MQTSKLLQLVKILDVEEMRWLAKFVRSPFYNSNKEVIALFDYIRKYHPECDSSKLAKEVVFKKIWPKEAFNDRRIRVLMFRLSDLVEAFLVAQKLKKDKIQHEKLLIQAVGERDLYEVFVKKTEVLLGQLENDPLRDESYFEHQWELRKNVLDHIKTNRLEASLEDFKSTLHHLDSFYMMTKLGYSSDLLNREKILTNLFC